jgi:hypothetical protein
MGDSYYITVPREFVRQHKLGQCDDVQWDPEADGVKLRFPKAPKLNPRPSQSAHRTAA